MEIRNFNTFKKIITVGSFTKAAEELGYAQSTLTAHIQSIETYYGKPIFDRIGKTVTLTAFGKELYHWVEQLLETYHRIEGLGNVDGQPTGVLRIGAPESLTIYRLQPVIQAYKRRYPEVEIIIVNDMCYQLRERLLAGELDLGFFLQSFGPHPQLEIEVFNEEPMCFVAPADFQGDDFVPDQHHMILYTEKDCNYRMQFEHYLNSKGHYPQNVLETGSVEAIKKYVLCGIGISYLPLYAVEEEARQGKLRIQSWSSGVTYYSQLAWNRQKWMNPAMAAFVELCRSLRQDCGFSSAPDKKTDFD